MGSTRLWESLDNGDTWNPLSNVFDGSVITAIEVPIHNGDIIYVGTTNGGFFRGDRIRKGSKKWRWSRNLAGPSSPGRTITRITTDPSDEKHVFFCVGSIAETAGFQEGQFEPLTSVGEGSGTVKDTPSLNLSRGGIRVFDRTGDRGVIGFDHVYESKDGGRTWDHTGGVLPNLPHNAVLMNQDGLLFAAHDGGVSVRFNGEWSDLSQGLPRIRVTDLALHETDKLLFASTYGRGIWRLNISGLKDALKAQVGEEANSKIEPVAAPPTP